MIVKILSNEESPRCKPRSALLSNLSSFSTPHQNIPPKDSVGWWPSMTLHGAALAMYQQDKTERRCLTVSLLVWLTVPFNEYRWTGRLGDTPLLFSLVRPIHAYPPLNSKGKLIPHYEKTNYATTDCNFSFYACSETFDILRRLLLTNSLSVLASPTS